MPKALCGGAFTFSENIGRAEKLNLSESNSRKAFFDRCLLSNKRAKSLYPVIQVGRKILFGA